MTTLCSGQAKDSNTKALITTEGPLGQEAEAFVDVLITFNNPEERILIL